MSMSLLTYLSHDADSIYCLLGWSYGGRDSWDSFFSYFLSGYGDREQLGGCIKWA